MATADSAAMKLDQYSLYAKDPHVTKITKSFYQTANVLKDIPLKTMPNLFLNGTRWINDLPSVTYGEINTTPTVVNGKPEEYSSRAYIIRNAFQYDTLYLKQPDLFTDPVQEQIDAWIQNLQYTVNNNFINNDPTASASASKVPPGLAWMLNNTSVSKLDSNLFVDAGALDIRPSAVTQAVANQFIEKFQSVITKMGSPDGEGIVAYMNDTTLRAFEAAVRLMGAGGGFTTDKDGFDRPILKYRGVTLRDIGQSSNSLSSSAEILTNTESVAGVVDGSGNKSSIYFVRYGENHFSGWQLCPLKPVNNGLSKENGVLVNVVIDWGYGFWIANHRSVGRLYDFRVA